MADYKKMYITLCLAIDGVIDELENIPVAHESANRLRKALLDAEEIYISTSSYFENSNKLNIIEMKNDCLPNK